MQVAGMNKIESYLEGKKSIAIAGHVSPDGDCIGSCMGLYIYLKDNYPGINADVYLSSVQPIYGFIKGIDEVFHYCEKGIGSKYDMLILLDISSVNRIGTAGSLYDEVGEILCLDHHKTNNDEYTYFYNDPDASSTAEVLYRHLDKAKISKECAEAIYMGIAHDTGVFRYTCTSPETMRIAAELMEKGIDFSGIIDETYYQKTFVQQKMQGYVLANSRVFLDGRFIVGVVTKKDRDMIGIRSNELDGIVSLLRDTTGVEVSMLLHELDTGEKKISMRSRKIVDVSEVCAAFGGGGHIRAAGGKSNDSFDEIIEKILPIVADQLKENG